MLLLVLLLLLLLPPCTPPCAPPPAHFSTATAAKSLRAFGGIVSGALFYFPGRNLSAPESTRSPAPTCVLAQAR